MADNSRIADDVLNEIHELNRSLLLLAQRMAASERTSIAKVLGVQERVAALLTGLSKEQIGMLARTGQLLWRFRWDAPATLEALSVAAENKFDILTQPEPSGTPGKCQVPGIQGEVEIHTEGGKNRSS
jgi:hypothetical protein